MNHICLLVALIATAGREVYSSSCQDRQVEDVCGSYCYKSLKPILSHIARLHDQLHNANEAGVWSSGLWNASSVLKRLQMLEGKVVDLAETPKSRVPPKDFIKIGSKFYYIEMQHKLNWFAAGYRCQELGGHLASIKNEIEWKAIKEQLDKAHEYWIDVNDLATEGTFLSHTTGQRAAYLNWDPTPWNGNNQPDNRANVEHCVHLFKNMFMNDADCTYPLNFICEANSP